MKKIIIILVVIIALAASGLYLLKTYSPKTLQRLILPKIEHVNKVDVKIEGDTAYIHSRMTALNESFFALKIDSIKYKVSVFDKVYLNDEQYLGLDVAPGKKDTISLKLKIPYNELIKDLRKARKKEQDSASYMFDVALIYSTVLGKMKLPVNREANFKIPDAPEIKLLDIHYKKLGLRNIIAEATIKIINHGEISLIIRDLSYEMKITDHGNAKGTHKASVNIKPHGETEVKIPIAIKILDAGKIIMDVIKNDDKYKYELSLHAVLGAEKLKVEPFDVKITKNGVMEMKK